MLIFVNSNIELCIFNININLIRKIKHLLLKISIFVSSTVLEIDEKDNKYHIGCGAGDGGRACLSAGTIPFL